MAMIGLVSKSLTTGDAGEELFVVRVILPTPGSCSLTSLTSSKLLVPTLAQLTSQASRQAAASERARLIEETSDREYRRRRD